MTIDLDDMLDTWDVNRISTMLESNRSTETTTKEELERIKKEQAIAKTSLYRPEYLETPCLKGKISSVANIEDTARTSQAASLAFPSSTTTESIYDIASTQKEDNKFNTKIIDRTLQLLADSNEVVANPEIALPDEVNALFATDEPEQDKRSFLLQVNQLVAEIMQLLSKLSDRDRTKSDGQRKNYEELNQRVADALWQQGKWNLFGSVTNFGVLIACSILGAAEAAQPLGSLAQSATGLYATQFSIAERTSSNKMTLISNDLQNTANKSGDNSGWKNELIQALNDTKECWRASVRSNG